VKHNREPKSDFKNFRPYELKGEAWGAGGGGRTSKGGPNWGGLFSCTVLEKRSEEDWSRSVVCGKTVVRTEGMSKPPEKPKGGAKTIREIYEKDKGVGRR